MLLKCGLDWPVSTPGKMKSVCVKCICPPAFPRMIAVSQRVADSCHSSSPLKLFDHVTENEITLKNTGKVGFEFKVLTDPLSSPDNLLPGVPLIVPISVSGHVTVVGGTQVQTCKL